MLFLLWCLVHRLVDHIDVLVPLRIWEYVSWWLYLAVRFLFSVRIIKNHHVFFQEGRVYYVGALRSINIVVNISNADVRPGHVVIGIDWRRVGLSSAKEVFEDLFGLWGVRKLTNGVRWLDDLGLESIQPVVIAQSVIVEIDIELTGCLMGEVVDHNDVLVSIAALFSLVSKVIVIFYGA